MSNCKIIAAFETLTDQVFIYLQPTIGIVAPEKWTSMASPCRSLEQEEFDQAMNQIKKCNVRCHYISLIFNVLCILPVVIGISNMQFQMVDLGDISIWILLLVCFLLAFSIWCLGSFIIFCVKSDVELDLNKKYFDGTFRWVSSSEITRKEELKNFDLELKGLLNFFSGHLEELGSTVLHNMKIRITESTGSVADVTAFPAAPLSSFTFKSLRKITCV